MFENRKVTKSIRVGDRCASFSSRWFDERLWISLLSSLIYNLNKFVRMRTTRWSYMFDVQRVKTKLMIDCIAWTSLPPTITSTPWEHSGKIDTFIRGEKWLKIVSWHGSCNNQNPGLFNLCILVLRKITHVGCKKRQSDAQGSIELLSASEQALPNLANEERWSLIAIMVGTLF